MNNEVNLEELLSNLTPEQQEQNRKADEDPEFVALMEEFHKEQQAKYGDPALDQMKVSEFFKRMPRKMRRKVMKGDTFSQQFKAHINKK